MPMKFASSRPFADPDIAVRKLIEIASTIEPMRDGRIYIELVNRPFFSAMAAVRRSTAQASSGPSGVAGSRCMRAGPT